MPDLPVVWKDEELSPIRDKVYQYIKQAIVQGVYKSGDRIIERELADQLNVSRTPIREALFRLESQGFVKTLPRKGVVVSKLTPEEIIEIFTILSALESLAVKLAVQKSKPTHAEQWTAIIHEIDAALAKPGTVEPGDKFHFAINDVICRAAQSPRLTQMLDGLSDYIRAFVQVGYELPGRQRKAMEEHRDLAKALRNGESELAENLIKIHIENSKKAYMEALERE
ncbi:GntR family transcriptional regulator [Paenibacillus allorhizosphaerae]|uniref:D-xylose utilization operon transcriptional repressor n=1 Tax=Paenibacillus allorhizosphaerae TaxID=2849866 RepID=A0ABN7TFD7_9BACL|nr:GntR family transcriptional regulator [Paenibacillus allorhizosphaerae]CAG7617715.1 putative D-xylose utilization operon transcriptional repressor [Paenibacillus allorhizosphaerae]